MIFISMLLRYSKWYYSKVILSVELQVISFRSSLHFFKLHSENIQRPSLTSDLKYI